MIWYVIPARKGSKGLPFKNRLLFAHTVNSIPQKMRSAVIISTDDKTMMKRGIAANCKVLDRSSHLATDEASTRDVLIDVATNYRMADDDIIVLLYLTFPERTYNDIQMLVSFFQHKSPYIKSLLCATPAMTHPYLCLKNSGDMKGEQIIEHDMCRRQEYPECFMVSHYVGIFRVNELQYLNRNMYNKDTVYFPIGTKLDIDTQNDYNKL